MTTTAAPVSVPVSARRERRLSLSGTPRWVGGGIGIVIIVLIWWLCSETVYTRTGAIPTPWATVHHYFVAGDWTILRHNFTPTIKETLWGFLWGDLLALLAAASVLLVPQLQEAVSQVAILSYCLPPIAIGAILAVATPTGSPITSIVLASMAPFFTTVVGTLVGLRAASDASLDLITAYGGSRLTQLRKVRVVAALPNVFAALKIAAPAAFLGAVLGEFVSVGQNSSVGVALVSAQSNDEPNVLWWTALTCGLVAGIGYAVVALLGRLVAPWSSGAVGGHR